MPACSVCGESMPQGTRTCSVCGTSMPEPAPAERRTPSPQPAPVNVPAALPPGGRYCPGCGTVYGVEYSDAFCICGAELSSTLPSTAPTQPSGSTATLERPPAGAHCLVLFGADRQPLHYFGLAKDAILIGRLDAATGNFPDIDLDEWLDAALARKISRQHALVLHSRVTGGYSLRPLAGNTGTQIETEMVMPLVDYPLAPGHHLILGGVARFKFEIA